MSSVSDQQVVNYLKGLVIDGVDAAGSGHPGGAMSSMDFAYLLLSEFMEWDPTDPDYFSRDRFVLSAGHESMLLYALLYAADSLTLDDLKQFRQFGSKTPGHPEVDITPHVECTTGPLGQGAAMSVGMALAATHLRHSLDEQLYAYHTWALLGDGCMQEEVTTGAAALAGHLSLPHLIWFYDCNKVQISGTKDRAASECSCQVFEGLGWQVYELADGHDHHALRQVLSQVRHQLRPCLIIAHTTMAKGAASLEGSPQAHGAPFSPQERAATKAGLNIPAGESFYFPPECRRHFQRNFNRLITTATKQRQRLAQLLEEPTFLARYQGYYQPAATIRQLAAANHPDQGKPQATRVAFGQILEQLAGVPALMGGSADLEPSNMTGGFAAATGDFTRTDRTGRNLAFGVREFTMACVCNGMALHGGFIPFHATFLVFSDYMRPALRLAALQQLRVICEFSHDSFYVGEDGPTHQPIEQLMSLRLIPRLYVMRPADANETAALMTYALGLDAPSALIVSRQKITPLSTLEPSLAAGYGEQAVRGAWIVCPAKQPDYILFATGSEVSLAVATARLISPDLSRVQVVSVPCFELFEQQDPDYRQKVLAPHCRRRISIEAGSTLGWQMFTGQDGLNIGVDTFSHSGTAADLAAHFGFDPHRILTQINQHFSDVKDA